MPQGWTKTYDFGDADLAASCALVAQGSADKPRRAAHVVALLDTAIYGSRLDAPADARLLRALLRAALDRNVLQASAPLPGLSSPIPTFASPAPASEVQRFVATLPDDDTPALLCLAANASRAQQAEEGRAALASLRKLGLQQSAAAGLDCAARRLRLQPFIDLWASATASAPALAEQDCDPQASVRVRPA